MQVRREGHQQTIEFVGKAPGAGPRLSNTQTERKRNHHSKIRGTPHTTIFWTQCLMGRIWSIFSLISYMASCMFANIQSPDDPYRFAV